MIVWVEYEFVRLENERDREQMHSAYDELNGSAFSQPVSAIGVCENSRVK